MPFVLDRAPRPASGTLIAIGRSQGRRAIHAETLDHEERIRFLGIGNETRSTLAAFGPVIAKELPAILDRFYAHLMKTPETAAKFPNERIKSHARDMQARHWVDGVFSGRFDQAYMEQVKRVGKAHERVGLEPRWYIGGYAMAMTEIVDLVAKKHPLNSKKAAEIIKAVVKAVFLDMDLAISSAGLPWLITRAKNGLEGLSLATSRHFDGIITDCRMPIMDGLELLRALRATRFFSAPVVMMTSGLCTSERKEVCAMGADIIYKGIDLWEIKTNLQCIHATFSRKCIAHC